jgi:hypothetical protein
MSYLGWILVIAVGVLNIAFNIQAQRAATHSNSWLDGIITLNFLALFLIGCASLVALYTLYLQQVILARGILLMGAISIVGGTLFGVLARGNRLDAIEWYLVVAIVLLFCYRVFRTLSFGV